MVSIIEQVCAGLQAAHDVGIVHRDLKPDNIFLCEGADLQVKLLDFGVAKLTSLNDAQIKHHTAAGSLIGTPEYMSPEQAVGASVTVASDVYALGLLMFVMVTGRHPFPSESLGGYLIHHRETAPPDPRSMAGVKDDVAELILSCLAKRPADRPASARAVVDALPGVSEPARPAAAPEATARVLLGAAGLLLAAGLAYVVWPNAEAPPPKPVTPTEIVAPVVIHRVETAPAAPDEVSVELDSTPPGATVTLLGPNPRVLGRTPTIVALPPAEEAYAFSFASEGHQQIEQKVKVEKDTRLFVLLPPVDPDRKRRLKRKKRKPRKPPRERLRKAVSPKRIIDPFDDP